MVWNVVIYALSGFFCLIRMRPSSQCNWTVQHENRSWTLNKSYTYSIRMNFISPIYTPHSTQTKYLFHFVFFCLSHRPRIIFESIANRKNRVAMHKIYSLTANYGFFFVALFFDARFHDYFFSCVLIDGRNPS